MRHVLHRIMVPNALAIIAGALGCLQPAMAAVLNNGSTIAAAAYAVMPRIRSPRQRSRRAVQP